MDGKPVHDTYVSGYQALCDDFERAVTDTHGHLNTREKCVAQITSALASQHWQRLDHLTGAALDAGLSGQAVAELCLQTAIYAGVAHFPQGFATVNQALSARGTALQFDPNYVQDVEQAALDMRQMLHGTRHNRAHADTANGFSGPLYEIVAHHGYGTIWTRPGLDLLQRLICALAGLSITGPSPVLVKFALTARNHAMSDAMLREIVIQTVLYQGSPRTLHALMAVEEALSGSH